ncbi:hypothetical protein BU16DRAFT_599230 [Lophium mytilinum]|uniref:Septin-type G domain-containing protein n=1 Tax=Lophium mytilinum TaxID=390894 RepID=A0A6A6R9X4_9PEZI|nr:hypothetical protein BU16DRAFT_599230 [Lophium mytilinum]
MRPTPGGDALPIARPRSRKSSVADHPAHTPAAAHNMPTSFFLRSEEDMEKSLAESTSTVATSKQKDSTYGVQSLADALESAFGDTTSNEKNANKADSSGRNADKQGARPRTPSRGPLNTDARQDDTSPRHVLARRQHLAQASHQAIPPSVSPSNLDSPAPESLIPGTPRSVSLKSFRLSDEESGADEAASQAIVSSEDDDEDTHLGNAGSFPQLVMPSIQMPSRRPFTEKGKSMGRLKVLIAGEAVGKTALIRSIVQSCEDIVHVDPLSPTHAESPPPTSESRKRRSVSTGTTRITEVQASTRAYPSWWSENEESRALRRRKSMGDTVLERNLCFIDTPGYGKNGSDTENMDLVIEYVESLYRQNVSIGAMSDGDLLGLMSGNGGLHVDVIFYLISPKEDMSTDVNYIQRLSMLTNVIPLISKADTLTSAQVMGLKNTLLARLQVTSIKPFLFGKTIQESFLAVQARSVLSHETSAERDAGKKAGPPQIPGHLSLPIPPYAISSTPGPDTETMDASLLMSPDYIQPLLPSELAVLVTQVFNPDTISWLRHSAAKKFLAWRSRTNFPGDSLVMHGYPQQRGMNSLGLNTGGFGGSSLQDPFSRLTTAPPSSTSSIFSAVSPSGVLVPHPHSPFYLSHANSNSNLQSPYPASSPSLSHSTLPDLEGAADFSLTRFNDHTQREERFAQVRLAKWANDLQRSLRNERERFEELQRNERAKWLLERVSEEVRGGGIVSSPPPTLADWAVVRHGSEKRISGPGARYGHQGRVDTRDPLGLCDFTDEVRRTGTVILKILGGMGMLGAVAVAVVKACGIDTGLGLPEGGVWSWITGGGK